MSPPPAVPKRARTELCNSDHLPPLFHAAAVHARGLVEVARERRWVANEVLHRGRQTLAVRWSVVGTDPGGGPFEITMHVVLRFDGSGSVDRQVLFPTDRSDEAVATARALDAEIR